MFLKSSNNHKFCFYGIQYKLFFQNISKYLQKNHKESFLLYNFFVGSTNKVDGVIHIIEDTFLPYYLKGTQSLNWFTRVFWSHQSNHVCGLFHQEGYILLTWWHKSWYQCCNNFIGKVRRLLCEMKYCNFKANKCHCCKAYFNLKKVYTCVYVYSKLQNT